MNKELINVRKANKDDARAWFTLLNKVWRIAYSSIFPEEVFIENENEIEKRIELFQNKDQNSHKNIAYVAEYNEKIIGIMCGTINSCYTHFHDNYAELMAIYVDPEYQGLKLGSKFKDIFEKWAKDNGATKYVIGVLKDNCNARKVYESWGCTLSDYEEKFTKLGIGYSEVFYIKKIK